ncbi:cysteine proteinase inhibitor 1-like [Cucumis sativus]|uniref:cysteine proteinase inhibitor 1-like n=1 Tax=Cucumis sativus TaxID=3659 RepID=UPI0012F4FFFC|nr:cysteine proteinase inhibitor 1-like [Cucumis sativus]
MSPEPIVGDYRPCENSDGEHAKDVAQWAVTEYNIKHRPEGHYLYLVRVLKCESQVVAGTNWRLLLECKDENNCVERRCFMLYSVTAHCATSFACSPSEFSHGR